MQLPKRLIFSLGLLASVALSALQGQDRPEIAQKVDGFTSPTAAIFSPDGRYLFVINHSQGEAGTKQEESFLSKLSVSESGEASMERARFVRNLTAPIDLDFSPVRYGSIPKGAIFMVVGSPLIQDSAGRAMRDLSSVFIGLLIIDPNNGQIIKRIDLGPNRTEHLHSEKTLLAPSSICFDDQGTLFIGESGVGGHMFERRQIGRPGIWRLEAKAVEALVEHREPENVELILTTSLPADMTYRASEKMLYFVTNHTQGRPSGSVFRISAGQYQGISSMQTIVRELDALTGIQLLPSGRVLLAGNSGELMFPKGKKATRPLRFRPKEEFSSPGKIALQELKGGTILIAVPEQSSDEGLGNGQRISMIKLPKNS